METFSAIYIGYLLNITYIGTEDIFESLSFDKVDMFRRQDNSLPIFFNSRAMQKCSKNGTKISFKAMDFIYKVNKLKSKENNGDLSLFLSETRNLFTNTLFTKVDSGDLFVASKHLEWPIKKQFYKKVEPLSNIINSSSVFIKNKLKNSPYLAIHLRSLEDSCFKASKNFNEIPSDLKFKQADYSNHCQFSFDKFIKTMTVLFENKKNKKSLNFHLNKLAYEKIENEFKLQVFIASDRQSKYVDESYFNESVKKFNFDKYRVIFEFKRYEYNCDKYCSHIDFEIVINSNLFIGLYVSTASRNMAAFRKYRENNNRIGKYYPSILFSNKNTNIDYFLKSNEEQGCW